MATEILDSPSSLGKRQRADDDDEPFADRVLEQNHQWGELPLVRHKQLWFEDGNIVVRVLGAPATPGGPPAVHGFKCHRSILARRSSFLRSVFELLPDHGDQPNVDGVPCLDFSDNTEDVCDLLLMIYGLLSWRDWVSVKGQDPLAPFDRLMRVAAKYEVVKEYEQFAKKLQGLLPVSYKAWTNEERGLQKIANTYYNSLRHKEIYKPEKNRFIDPVEFSPEPARALMLVEELGLKGMLRAAWYHVARAHACGPTPFKSQSDAENSEDEPERRQTLKLELLSGSQMRRLLVGRERLVDALEPRIRDLHSELEGYEEEPPEPHAECLASVRKWWEEAMCGARFVELVRDPLGELLRLQTCLGHEAALREYHGTCSGGCSYEWFQARLQSASNDIWDLLPEIFGFDA